MRAEYVEGSGPMRVQHSDRRRLSGHNQSVEVRCVAQFQPSHNGSVVCHNGTWNILPKCIPAKCRELPDAPRNGMVVAPNMDHGMVGKFEVNIGKYYSVTFCSILMDFYYVTSIGCRKTPDRFYKIMIILRSLDRLHFSLI